LIKKIYIRGPRLMSLETVFLGVPHLISGAPYLGTER